VFPQIAAMLLRYFLAEGAAASHACCWAAPADLQDDQLWLPQQTALPHQQRQQEPAAANGICPCQPQSEGAEGNPQPQPQQQDHLRIAWQYRRYMGGRADAAHAPHPAHQNAFSRCTHSASGTPDKPSVCTVRLRAPPNTLKFSIACTMYVKCGSG
jgi:PAXNEB protein